MRLMALVVLLASGAGAAAHAQASDGRAPDDEAPRGVTIQDRPRPNYDARGLRTGGFLIFPEVAVQETYDSNIFATERNERADLITTVVPSVDVRSDWNNHAVNLHADAVAAKYADNGSEDYVDRTLLAGGRLDVRRDTRVYGSAGYRVRHEARSSPDNVAASAEPTGYSVASVGGGAETALNRLSFALDTLAERYRYDDDRDRMGRTIDQGGRNRDQVDMRLRTGYELMPLRQVYLLTAYHRRDYDRAVDAGGFDRDSNGFTIGPGVHYDLDGIVLVDLFAGYRQQDFADRRLATVRTGVADGRVTWNVTRLTTITGGLSRELAETTIAGASSYIVTRAELRADHELMRNVLLNARIGYERDSFEGIDRRDDYFAGGIGAKYLVSRYLAVSGGYAYRERDSDLQNNDFREHSVTLRVGAHF